MKRLLFAAVLALAAVVTTGAQGVAAPAVDPSGSPAPAARALPGTAPRPVHFAPARSTARLDREGAALLDRLPAFLAASIAALQPIAQSPTAAAAVSIVEVTADPSAAGRVAVTASLLEGGESKAESRQEFAGSSFDLARLEQFVEETAARFAPLLTAVESPTETQRLMATPLFIETMKETDFLDGLDRRWELTLWMSGLMRIMDSSGMDSTGNYAFTIGVGPLIGEVTWFPWRDLGVQLSIYFNQTSAFDFGGGSRGNASGIFIFPGIGVVYRTIGRVAVELNATVSAGMIHVSADYGDVRDRNNNVVIPYGSSVWTAIVPRLHLSPAVVWHLSPALAVKGSVALDFIPPNVFPWYDSPLSDMQFLSIGISYTP
jgi:hypothetical protein